MNRLLVLSRILMAAAALTFAASSAQAAGVAAGLNLSWSECGAAGTLERNFACSTNSGSNIMFGSAVVGTNMEQLNGQASVLDLQTNEATLSAWWQLATGACRGTSLSSSFDFTANSACLDPWSGAAAGGISYTPAFNGPNRARIRTVCAIPGSTSITGTDEYYFFKVTVLNSRTVGNGSCAGCADGACIVFNSILVTQPLGVGDILITNPLQRAYVVWQSGGTSVTGGCPAVTPTRSRTWGSVKSLYR